MDDASVRELVEEEYQSHDDATDNYYFFVPENQSENDDNDP